MATSSNDLNPTGEPVSTRFDHTADVAWIVTDTGGNSQTLFLNRLTPQQVDEWLGSVVNATAAIMVWNQARDGEQL